jgi:hypothetical protein
MWNVRGLRSVLALDAAFNALLAVVLLVAARPLAGALGDVAVWPLIAVAAFAGVNAVLCLRGARTEGTDRGLVRSSAAIDGLFAVAVIGLAVADPTGAAPWLRWALGGLGALSALVAEFKWIAAARRPEGAVARG